MPPVKPDRPAPDHAIFAGVPAWAPKGLTYLGVGRG